MNNRYSRVLLGIVLSLSTALMAAPAFAQTTVAGTTPGQFSVNESGAATYSIPIQIPPGVAGMQPQLSLGYSSQSGNGLLGVGWSLSGLSAISRCPRTMAQDAVRGSVNYDMNDRYCLDGQRLMLVSGTYGAADSEYRTESESFSRITAYGSAGNGPAYFTVQTKSGLTTEYGNTVDSRVEAQGKTSVWVWAVNKINDVKTNFMTFTYTEDNANGNYYINRIDYAGNTVASQTPANSVQFVYETRPDIERSYQGGSLNSAPVRLISIKTYSGISPVKDYKISYSLSSATQRSRVVDITECVSGALCLPSSLVNWESGAVSNAFAPVQNWGSGGATGYWSSYGGSSSQSFHFTGDFNGDGRTDFIYLDGGSAGWRALLANDAGFAPMQNWGSGGGIGYTGLWTSTTSQPFQFTGDFNGDGKTDLMYWNDNAWFALLSTGTGFEPVQNWGKGGGVGYWPYWTNTSSQSFHFPADMNGDGKTDFMYYDGDHGGWQVLISTGAGFAPVQNWGSGGGIGYTGLWTSTTSQPFQFTGDFNGDGKTDLMYWNDNAWFALLSTGTGFEPVQNWGKGGGVGYWPYWTNTSSQSFHFPADMNGDGKTDFMYYDGDHGGWQVLISTGTGFAPVQNWGTGGGVGHTGLWTSATSQIFQRTGDFNGDGRTDLIYWNPSVSAWQLLPSVGSSFGTMQDWGKGGSSTGYWPDWSGSSSQPFQIVGDFNGDGKTDIAFWNSGWNVLSAQSSTYDRLSLLNKSGGQAIGFGYKPLTDSSIYAKDVGVNAAVYPKVDLQHSQYVVSTVSTSNGVGGVNTVQYNYGGLKAEQGTGRGSLGFRWMKSKSVANNIESYTEFNQNHPFTGTVARNETRLAGSGNAGLLKRTVNTYAQSPGSAGTSVFVYPSQSVEESWDLSGTPYPSSSTSYVYGQNPQYGDPTQITVSNSEGSSKATVNEYWPVDSNNWILGRLKKASVTSVKP